METSELILIEYGRDIQTQATTLYKSLTGETNMQVNVPPTGTLYFDDPEVTRFDALVEELANKYGVACREINPLALGVYTPDTDSVTAAPIDALMATTRRHLRNNKLPPALTEARATVFTLPHRHRALADLEYFYNTGPSFIKVDACAKGAKPAYVLRMKKTPTIISTLPNNVPFAAYALARMLPAIYTNAEDQLVDRYRVAVRDKLLAATTETRAAFADSLDTNTRIIEAEIAKFQDLPLLTRRLQRILDVQQAASVLLRRDDLDTELGLL